jgi:tight adherence protein B
VNASAAAAVLVLVCGFAARFAGRRARAATSGHRVRNRLAELSVDASAQWPQRWLAAQITELELPVDATRAWLWWRAAALGLGGGGALLGGPLLGLIAVGAVAAAPVVACAVLRSRADAAYDATLATALDAVGRGVRSGGSLVQGVAEAVSSVRGAVAADIGRVASAVTRGLPFADALLEWRDQRDRASVRLAVGALVLASQTGGPPARVIEDVSAAIRTRQQVEREAHALAAQARLSAIVVGVAPIGFALVASVADKRNAQMLFGTPIGVACVVVGLSLDALGAVWMHRISASVLR